MDRWTDAVAKSSLVLSALVAVVEACFWGSDAIGWIEIAEGTNLRKTSTVLAGTALSLAVISAGSRVFRSASAIAEASERYRFQE